MRNKQQKDAHNGKQKSNQENETEVVSCRSDSTSQNSQEAEAIHAATSVVTVTTTIEEKPRIRRKYVKRKEQFSFKMHCPSII